MTTALIDKSEWGEGPWQDEPDRIEWREGGYPCLMARVAYSGAWCGYVAVPPGHPWHGKDRGDVDMEIHGEFTYAGPCRGHVCHVPKDGESDDVWWLGFDCAHFGDFVPSAFFVSPFSLTESYKDLYYVRRECQSLAEQLLHEMKL